MKTHVLGLSLFALTAVAVAFTPMQGGKPADIDTGHATVDAIEQAPSVEVVFVLDTTGSMSGLIDAAKEKIWSIASSLAQAEHAPEIRLGLVAFRDRGDQYVTRVTELSPDLDRVYATLMDYKAAGGGDTPESVNRALHEAVNGVAWSKGRNTYQAIFLVGDAPPHNDYQDEPGYAEVMAQANQRGIRVNTIQAGDATETRRAWQRIAALGAGQYFQVASDGDAVALESPFDEALAKLSKTLDATRLYYGDDEVRAKQAAKVAATDKLHAAASVSSRARRATFNASESGGSNLLGENELVDAVSRGDVELANIDKKELPAPLKDLSTDAAKAKIDALALKRQRLQAEIRDLAEQRSAWLKESVEKAGGAEDSLDDRIYETVRSQAASQGLRYEPAAPAY